MDENQAVNDLDLLGLKSLSKEQRIVFSAEIRKDPELWNPVHGLGGHSETSKNGLIQGTIFDKKVQLQGAEIAIIDEEGTKLAHTTSNQYGHFSIELSEADYTLKISHKDRIQEATIKIRKGVTTSYNYDFDKGNKDVEAPMDPPVEKN